MIGYQVRVSGFGGRDVNRFVLGRVRWMARSYEDDGRAPLFEVSASLVWEPRDLWVGCYWTPSGYGKVLVYLCVIPCVPLRLHFKRIFGVGGIG